MTPEEVWRKKSDEELIAASRELHEFTDDGQRVILAELAHRRESGLMSQRVAEDDAAETGDPSGTADTAGGHLNGVRRLWCGHVSLPMTYWLWGVVVSLLLRIVTAVAEAAGEAILALLLALFGIVYYAFISVAIWRSAGRYRGKSLWANLAQISVAAGVALVVVTMLFG